MCGGGKVVRQDPEADALKAAQQAAIAANADAAQRKVRKNRDSLQSSALGSLGTSEQQGTALTKVKLGQ